MTDRPPTDALIDRPPRDVSKIRLCLKCRSEFESQWSGERLCKRCKSSKAWRAGGYAQPRAAGGQ
jgi:hypothetical protein